MAVTEKMNPHIDASAFTGLHIIDCDTHFTEPPDLWASRVPLSMRHRVPVQKTTDGSTSWYLNGDVWSTTGGNTIRTGGQKVLGVGGIHPFDAIDPAAWSVPHRLRLMDEMGVYAAIVYPNGVGFASNHIFAIDDEDQRKTVLEVYNDFYCDIQAESNGRLFPQAMLPIWDMDLTVKEMTRLLDRGIRGFTLSDKPELLGLPELPDAYFSPMWDLLNESGAAVNFHISSGATRAEVESTRKTFYQPANDGPVPRAIPTVADKGWQYLSRQRRGGVFSVQAYMSNVRIIANMCMCDIFDRYPKLKIVSVESGIGWVPFILESLEYQVDEMVTTEPIPLACRPTEYFREHFYVTFWYETLAPSTMLDAIGVHNVLVETDIPHNTCLYPNPQEHFSKVLSGLDRYTVSRVLQDNAADLYAIELPG